MSNGGVKRKLAVLDRDAFLEKSKAARMQRCPQGHFIKAMYSSLVDAIITDPELMAPAPCLARGHAVFDTCTLANGCVYRLGLHLDRLFTSAKLAKLKLPFGDSEEKLRGGNCLRDLCRKRPKEWRRAILSHCWAWKLWIHLSRL
ncbi:unnamed protein product [Durusdinium trenchii]|uniref:Uncharacterized protein n=1 Tax=Durusdinium trenchii TaxID=1381693 RepID=A0ABP0PN55_9DINO